MDRIYIIDEDSRKPRKIGPVSFQEIGIKERHDLESWVLQNPDLLGEELLVITSEFDKFDKSNRRLDLLALDQDATLVVIELKLDAAGSLADLQAIRYAAFCSTMTMASVVDALASFEGFSASEATEKILHFLKQEELPQLGDRPRIILATGSIEDQELTSTVMWLRKFGVDISCVELTPYRLPDVSKTVLVPRTIIPVPEAKEYLVSVEQKEAQQVQVTRVQNDFRRLWKAVSMEFNKLGMQLRAPDTSSGPYLAMRFRHPNIHYEWALRRREHRLDVALHFEFPEAKDSFDWLNLIEPHSEKVSNGVNLDFSAAPWGKRWAEVKFRIPYEGDFPEVSIAPRAAEVMKILLERTWPLLEPKLRSGNGRQ